MGRMLLPAKKIFGIPHICLDKIRKILYNIFCRFTICDRGGIGIRARLRGVSSNGYGFKSRRPHHVKSQHVARQRAEIFLFFERHVSALDRPWILKLGESNMTDCSVSFGRTSAGATCLCSPRFRTGCYGRHVFSLGLSGTQDMENNGGEG